MAFAQQVYCHVYLVGVWVENRDMVPVQRHLFSYAQAGVPQFNRKYNNVIVLTFYYTGSLICTS